MKKLSFLFITTSVFLISILSCNKNEDVPAAALTISNLSYHFLDNKLQTFTINPNVPTVINGSYGTRIEFSGSNFTDGNGNTLMGGVDIELIELYKLSSMILANIPTLADEGGQIVPLSSGGEFYISAKQNGTPVIIANPLSVYTAPVTTPVNNMQLFNGSASLNGDLIWNLADTTALAVDTLSSYGFPWAGDYNWVNCDYFWNSSAPQTSVSVNLPSYCNSNNTNVYLAFTNETSATSIYSSIPGEFGTSSYYSLPEGLDMHVVVTTVINGQLEYAVSQSTIVTNHVETISSLISIDSIEELEILLDGIL